MSGLALGEGATLELSGSLTVAGDVTLAAGSELILKGDSHLIIDRLPVASAGLDDTAIEKRVAAIVSGVTGGVHLDRLLAASAWVGDMPDLDRLMGVSNMPDLDRLMGIGNIAESMRQAIEPMGLWAATVTRQIEPPITGFSDALRAFADQMASERAAMIQKMMAPIGLQAYTNQADILRQALDGVGPAAWPGPARPPERRPARLPEPPPEPPVIEVVQLGESSDWRAALSAALAAGQAQPAEVVALLHAHTEQQPLPAAWQAIEAVALSYKARGHRYQNLELFAIAIGYSRSTVQRYLHLWRQHTGENLLPGRGRARRKS